MAENDKINLRAKLNSMSWNELRKEAAFYSIKANMKKVPMIDAIIEKMAAEEDPLLDMSALSMDKFVEPFRLSNSCAASRGLNLDATIDVIHNATFDVINDSTFDAAHDATYDVINDATFDVINDKTYDVLDTSGKQPDDQAIESVVGSSGRMKMNDSSMLRTSTPVLTTRALGFNIQDSFSQQYTNDFSEVKPTNKVSEEKNHKEKKISLAPDQSNDFDPVRHDRVALVKNKKAAGLSKAKDSQGVSHTHVPVGYKTPMPIKSAGGAASFVNAKVQDINLAKSVPQKESSVLLGRTSSPQKVNTNHEKFAFDSGYIAYSGPFRFKDTSKMGNKELQEYNRQKLKHQGKQKGSKKLLF